MEQAYLYFACFMLVLARIIGFFVQAPIFGSNHINNKVLVGLSVSMAIVIFPNVPIPKELPGGPIVFLLLLLSQITIGLVIGYVAFLCMAAAQFGGELLDMQMGLSSAAASDPSSKGTINLIRRLQFYVAMILYLVIDGHHILFKATARSFDIIPLTGTRFSGTLIMELIHMTGRIFYIGAQIALPALGALFMVQIALGIMARVAPQMNVFMLSFPLNIMVGLTLLIASIPMMYHVYVRVFEEFHDKLIEVLELLVPQ
ncbi:MAG: flagellar biosynthetic protein FliR [Candidatus Eremiobacteraeota bacterium]|nr:flagellar biosynthetic protein FliR [Candidatus Eremiobacteraeota bacterium]